MRGLDAPNEGGQRCDDGVAAEREECDGDDPQRTLLPSTGSRRVNCDATAAAESASIVESKPNAISAPEEATHPALIATTA